MEHTRLNTNQFLSLRSIGREPWGLQGGHFQWRFHKKWVRLCRNDDPYLYKRASDAAWDLEKMGLAEVFTVRCCQNPFWYANDRQRSGSRCGGSRCSAKQMRRTS